MSVQLSTYSTLPIFLFLVHYRYIPRRRVVHLDLKGAPPKMSYLEYLFPLVKSAGATTLLIEYEDMFPFWGEIRNLSALNAYTKEDVRDILDMAKKNKLEVKMTVN